MIGTAKGSMAIPPQLNRLCFDANNDVQVLRQQPFIFEFLAVRTIPYL
jgi:hypothetical protein